MSETFENELAALDKVTGIHIGETESTFDLCFTTRTVFISRTWKQPDKLRLGFWEWIYLYSTAYYWIIRLCS